MIRRLAPSEAHAVSAAQAIPDLAAAVKELAENALDAGASAVSVTLRASGLSGLEVTDDGRGIARQDMPLLGRRSHTSKIEHDADILTVGSYGFRGEALHALATVSTEVRVRSRACGATECGYEVLLVGLDASAAAPAPVTMNPGTTVSVVGLLAAYPVRRGEWERGTQKAMSKALSVVQALVVARPGVRFRVVHFREGGRGPQTEVLLASTGSGDVQRAFCEAYGAADKLKASTAVVGWCGCATTLRLWHAPEASRRAADRQLVVYAGRPVDMPRLARRLNDTWRRAREGMRRDGQTADASLFPVFLVYIEPDRNAPPPAPIEEAATAPEEEGESSPSGMSALTQSLRAFASDEAAPAVQRPRIAVADVNFAPDKRQILLQDEGVLVDAVVGMLESSLAQSAVVSSISLSQTTLPATQPKLESAIKRELAIQTATVNRDATPTDNGRTSAMPLDVTSKFTGSSADGTTVVIPAPSPPCTETQLRCRGLATTQDFASAATLATLQTPEARPPGGLTSSVAPDAIVDQIRRNILAKSGSAKLNTALDGAAGDAVTETVNHSADAEVPMSASCCDDAISNSHIPSQDPRTQADIAERTRTDPDGCEGEPLAGATRATTQIDVPLERADFASMRVIGQFNRGFILASLPGECSTRVFIVDQHASDERHRLERLERALAHGVQRLVAPLRVDRMLSPQDQLAARDHADVLGRLGFTLSFGEAGAGDAICLTTLPVLSGSLGAGAPTLAAADFCEALGLMQAGEFRGLHSLRRVAAVLASRACRSAVMVGDALSRAEMRRVVGNLAGLDKPWICAHGRPTIRLLCEIPEA